MKIHDFIIALACGLAAVASGCIAARTTSPGVFFSALLSFILFGLLAFAYGERAGGGGK